MLRLPALLTLLATPVLAGGTLEGRVVTLNVLTYDDPAAPILESRGRTVTVGEGVEFGMGPEYRTPGFDVVPVQVQIGPARIEFSYGEGNGQFWAAKFNGYVLRFVTECALFESVAIDEAATTMPVTMDDIRADVGALYINVQGRDYGPDVTLALDLVITDCPLS
ncbi:MAG: hypothetical protein ACT4OK_12200 [Gemmobacter sp.]